MYTEAEIIEGCKQEKPAFQEALYNLYASRMMGICSRYAKTRFEAEDVFQEAFVRVFQHIKSFQGEGSFEGWMKRIFLRTAINNFHKNKNHYQPADLAEAEDASDWNDDFVGALTNQELIAVINRLPEGYKLVFNLYAIEGYTHKEIAEMLNIAEGTSKSQLAKAKALLRKWLSKLSVTDYADRSGI